MRTVALLAAVAAAKLVITAPGGITVTDYASMERCEAARTVFLRKVQEDAEARVPKGYKMVVPPTISAICIPA